MPSRTGVRLQLLALGVACAAQAQTTISLDGSLRAGSPTGPIAPLSPGIYEIRESDGTPSGDNLFHSFGDFDIGAGDRATFTGENEYERVIARVTGGEPSRIDGTLASTVMRSVADGIGADVYLLNPWGLLFGPSSSVDVRTSAAPSSGRSPSVTASASPRPTSFPASSSSARSERSTAPRPGASPRPRRS